jgi:alpha-galactosidase
MDQATFEILSAKELIAVNQDSLGVQGDLIYQLGPIQIWAGPLADGSRAFILFNRHTPTQYDEPITLNFADLGFPRNTVATVKKVNNEKIICRFVICMLERMLDSSWICLLPMCRLMECLLVD